MKLTTTAAFRSMVYNRNRNFLMGTAVFLTTLLLFLVPGIGCGGIALEHAAVNELYPDWHAVFLDVEEGSLDQLRMCSGIERVGVRFDAAQVVSDKDIGLYYFDDDCLEMNKLTVEEGRLPEREDEIVLSRGILKVMGIEAGMGGRLTLPYQLRMEDGLGYAGEGEFTLCGLLSEAEGEESGTYAGVVSGEFVRGHFAGQERDYQVYIRVKGAEQAGTTDEVKAEINNIAGNFHLDTEKQVRINDSYLSANLPDPSALTGMAAIMLVIVAAGVITVYSVFSISMVQSVQEYGKWKAVGATERQIRQIVWREGMMVTLAAVPPGLLLGSILLPAVMRAVVAAAAEVNTVFGSLMLELVNSGKIPLLRWWLYLLAGGMAVFTVAISLRKPMRTAAAISPVEAMRFHRPGRDRKAEIKGYEEMNVTRLAMRNLADNRKRTWMTILAMAATGGLFVAVSTVLACATPEGSADNRMPGEYELRIDEEENKEHPEYAWSQIQKDNPLSEELREKILRMDGAEEVETFVRASFETEGIEGESGLLGLPEKYWNKVVAGIEEGETDPEVLRSGQKAVLNSIFLRWYPELKVGDSLSIEITDGDRTRESTVEIAAIADIPFAISQYDYFIMPEDKVRALCENNQNYYFHVQADRKYDADLEKQLRSAVEGEKVELTAWEEEYRRWKSSLALIEYLCYGFLAVLGAVCLMNLVNTMADSIHDRRRELGILQALGLSGRQLSGMLWREGLIYTAGTLSLSLGVGLIAGYGIYLYARSEQLLNITQYRFPAAQSAFLSVVVLAVQLVVVPVFGRMVRKESLMDRIRLQG